MTRVRVAFDTTLGVVFTTLMWTGKGAVVVDGEKARQAVADAHGLPFADVFDLVYYETLS